MTFTVFRTCSAGDNNIPVPGTPNNTVRLVGVQLSRQSLVAGVTATIRRTAEQPAGITTDPLIDAYIYNWEAAGGAGASASQPAPVEVRGGDQLVLNSTGGIYALLFFDVS